MNRLIACLLPVLICSPVLACDFDVDCDVGARCVKRSAIEPGICQGGMWPGDKNDDQFYNRSGQRKQDAPRRGERGEGKQCVFNADCEIGQSCLKDSLYGVCVSR